MELLRFAHNPIFSSLQPPCEPEPTYGESVLSEANSGRRRGWEPGRKTLAFSKTLSRLQLQTDDDDVINLPEPDMRKLTAAPLVLVVAQVRFGEPIDSADKKVGKSLKTALARVERHFKLERLHQQAIQMTLAPSAVPQFGEAEQTMGWKLERSGTTMTIFPDAVTLETTSYIEWSDFRAEFAAVLEAVKVAASPESCQRIGLRMVNNIHRPEIGTPRAFQTLIEDWLLGPMVHDALAPGVLTSQQQHDLEIDESTRATVRAGIFRDVTDRLRMTFLLDLDAYDLEYRDYVVDELMQRADDLDRRIVQLFHASIRPEFKTELQNA